MREAAWLKSTSPRWMLDRRRGFPGFDERKLRLFAAACCRRVWDLLVDVRSREALEALERFLDDRETLERLEECLEAAVAAEATLRWVFEVDGRRPTRKGSRWLAANAVLFAAAELSDDREFGDPPVSDKIVAAAPMTASSRSLPLMEARNWRGTAAFKQAHSAEEAAQADLLREVLGNPFRPPTFDPSWRSSDVLDLARTIDDRPDFGPMPILGDALEEAGCDRMDILDHCRSAKGHVRGCWVLDLVLERGGPFGFETPTPDESPGFWRSVRRLVGFDRG